MVARVLVVEDDSTVSSVLSAYLRKAGFEPRIAADGATALQEWTQWKPDVVILDVMLPKMTGLEVLQRRRADDDGAAVIILSARGDEDDRLFGLEVGADASCHCLRPQLELIAARLDQSLVMSGADYVALARPQLERIAQPV